MKPGCIIVVYIYCLALLHLTKANINCQLELHVHFQWVWKYLAAHAELKCASVEIQKVNEKIPSQESTKAIWAMYIYSYQYFACIQSKP